MDDHIIARFDDEVRSGMAKNRANWDSRVAVHAAPGGYDLDFLVNDPTALSDVVRFDRRFLGDLSGQDVVHLQCHMGSDTLSLSRLGASVTGLDFSGPALDRARDQASRAGIEARFVQGDLYDAAAVLGRTYDLVYTGIGAINWLPDIRLWAQVVAALLRPGGLFHITEGHPMVMVFSDDSTPDDLPVDFSYFDGSPPLHWHNADTYGGAGSIESPDHVQWAHDLGSIVQALIDAGLTIERFEEHRVLPWLFFPWLEEDPDLTGWYRLPDPLGDRIPLSFTIQARKGS